MKKFFVLIGLLLLFASASYALDVEDFLNGSGSSAAGLERIQNTILANQNGSLDRFLSGTDDHPSAFPGGKLDQFLSGTDSSGGLVRSPVQAIIDDFVEKGLATPTGADGLVEGTADDLPFFSGSGTGLFSVSEDDDDNVGDLIVLGDEDDEDL